MSILIGGIVFLIIGILVSKQHKWKKFKTYIPILLGLFLMYISTVGPLSETKNRINEITKIDYTKVKSVTTYRNLQDISDMKNHLCLDKIWHYANLNASDFGTLVFYTHFEQLFTTFENKPRSGFWVF
jgi:hypothetical protein